MTETPKKASDPSDLERKILDPNTAKNEAEWWAREKILELEQQLAERDAELKRINHAINDPRVDLTITAAEAITDLRYKLVVVSSLLREASGRSSYGNWSTEFRINVEKALAATEPKEEVK